MNKIINQLFPILDHLYIFQVLEYNSLDFLKWFIKNPLKRNLQRKHALVLTQKAKLLFFLSVFLIVFSATDLFWTYLELPPGHWYSDILLFISIIALLQLSPLFLILSQIILFPIFFYQKSKILSSAQKKLKKLPNLKIIAITGSFGKTSTKNILYTLLWKKFRVVKTPRSYNNTLSIAQTILGDLKDNTEVFICEVGAYKKGEIKDITKWLKPDIGVITAIAPQHLEKFGSLENILRAKFELVEGLKENGVAILNSESELLKAPASRLDKKIVWFGKKDNPIHATNIEISEEGTSFLLHTPKGHQLITIPLIGEHHVKNFLAATSVALVLGLNLNEIRGRAKSLLQTPHRMEIKKQGNLTIIDNSYNTNPDSAKLSFKLLSQLKATQKIIITPGLIGLGRQSEEKNMAFAKGAALVSDEIIIVGENFRDYLIKGLKEGDFPAKKIHSVSSLGEGINLLTQISKPGAVVLIENDLPDQYF